jgi:putative flippase GtrA
VGVEVSSPRPRNSSIPRLARRLLLAKTVSPRARQVFRVAACGLASTGIDVLALIALVELARLPPGLAAFLSAATGAVLNFTGNKLWAFGDASPLDARQFAAYALVCVGSWSFVALLVHALCAVGTPYLAAKAVSAVLVFAAWSYPVQARYVFPRPVRP